MPAGKSSERLAEEIAAYTPELPPLFGLSPIEVYKTVSSQVYEPDFSGYCLSALPVWPKVFNGYFVSSRTHIEVESDRNLTTDVNGEVERDWQIADRSIEGNVVAITCGLTGAQLTINVYGPEIPALVRSTFTSSALAARSAAVAQNGGGPPAAGDRPSTSASTALTDSWELLARIVNDLLSTSPEDRRSISGNNPKPARLLDLPVVLPFLGFKFDEETHLYRPPHDSSPEYLRRMRRILLEIRFETLGFNFREPLLPLISRFLGGISTALGEAHFSPAAYGCLGSITTFSDERLLTRFEMALQNDGVHGGPWYLEALKTVAQRTKSELLETKVIELISLGTPTVTSLQDEFARLGLSLETESQLSDSQLIDLVMAVPPFECKSLLSAICSTRPTQIWQRASAAPLMNADDALQVFSVDTLDDNTIAERFHTIWNQGATIDKLEARFALQTLALSTKSAKLLALYESVAPVSREPLPTYEEALAMVGITPDVSDQDTEAIFEANTDDVNGFKLLELRRALHVIAEKRQSRYLLAYLTNTDESSNEELTESLIDFGSEGVAGPRLPVGLWNIGNTCYLNSLLQFYYSLPAVREYLLAYHDPTNKTSTDVPISDKNDNDDDDIKEIHLEADTDGSDENTNNEENDEYKEEKTDSTKVDSNDETVNIDVAENCENASQPTLEISSKKIGGRLVPPKEIRRSQIFVDRLGKLFRQIHDAPTAHITPSEILAYMALVPPNEDADDVIAASGSQGEEVLRGRLIGALQRQQDVTECIENVLDQLEATMEATSVDPDDQEQYDLVKELFYGSTIQTLARVEDGKNRRTKTERFSSLLLDVSDGPTSVYDSLDNYFGDNVLDLEDGRTLRTLRLKSVPEILQVQVQRVQFDKNTYLPYKNLNHLIFPEKIYIDRYLKTESGSDLDLRTQKVKNLRAELRQIEDKIVANGDIATRRDSLATTLDWLTDGNLDADTSRRVSDATLLEVKAHHTELCQQLASLDSRKEEINSAIEHEFDDLQEYGYRIHALFIHKGDVSYGHYWIYIRDMNTGEFYKYNDEIVSRVSPEEVFDFSESNLATPYFLVFVRDR